VVFYLAYAFPNRKVKSGVGKLTEGSLNLPELNLGASNTVGGCVCVTGLQIRLLASARVPVSRMGDSLEFKNSYTWHLIEITIPYYTNITTKMMLVP